MHSDEKLAAAMSSGGSSLAASPGAIREEDRHAASRGRDDEHYSDVDSQDELDTLMSSDWGGGQLY